MSAAPRDPRGYTTGGRDCRAGTIALRADEVMLMLPARPSRVLGRELLYTALTRARHRVTVVAPAAVLADAAATPTRRRSGLQARLAEASAAPPDR